MIGGPQPGTRIAVLTPVRNGERDLPDFLRSAEQYADLVIALDDGSTDFTSMILESAPLVAEVLTNPMRPTYEGWDDAENRARLLRAFAERQDADWALFLDADERLDAADGQALRELLATDAVPGFAYGFQVLRMVENIDSYDAGSGLWVYRLFANGPDLDLPARRLHFVPVPVAIPRHRWIRTTLRIQHVGSLTEQRRVARFAKYEEADPQTEFQSDYHNLLTPPVDIRAWKPRSPGAPFLVDHETRLAAVEEGLVRWQNRPVISAIVISQNDEATIAESVGALASQRVEGGHEIIVVTSGTDGTADVVRERFPVVRVVQLPRPALPGEARNAGLWLARGEYVTFPGSHVVVEQGSLQARVDAHEAGWDLVTGTTLNGNSTRPGWASYFLDHSAVLPGRSSGRLRAAPAHCSYVTSDLDQVGGFPEDMRAGEDTIVNQRLFAGRRLAYREASAAIIHTSPCRTTMHLVRHHFGRGRAWGRILLSRVESRRWLIRNRSRAVLAAPWRRMRTANGNARAWAGSIYPEYRSSRALVALGAVAAGVGTWYQLIRGGAATSTTLDRAKVPGTPTRRLDDVPLVVAHYGSPLSRDLGILGFGSKAQAIERVVGHAGRQKAGAFEPAIYLLARAAAVTAGKGETYSVPVPDEEVQAYQREAEAAGAKLILGIQPGRVPFLDALMHHRHLLTELGVGVGLEPAWGATRAEQPAGATSWPGEDLDEALRWLADVRNGKPPMLVLIHHTTEMPWPSTWRAPNLEGLDIIALAEGTGTTDQKVAEMGSMSEVAPAVGLQVRLREDHDLSEPSEVLSLVPRPRIVVYR